MSRKRKRGGSKEKELPDIKRRKIQESQSSSPGGSQSLENSQSSQSSQPISASQQKSRKRGRKKRKSKPKKSRKKKRVPVSEEVKKKLVNLLIRYVLSLTSGSKVVKKEDIRKYVLSKSSATKGHSGLVEELIKIANGKLRLTFGYELVEMTTKMRQDVTVETNIFSTQQLEIGTQQQRRGGAAQNRVVAVGTKVWVLRLSQTPSPSFHLSENQVEQRCEELMSMSTVKKLGLLTIITGLIYGKRDNLPENVLWNHLKRIGVEKGVTHPDFDGKPERIIQEFIRGYYIIREKDEVESKHEGKPVYRYRYGPRIYKDVNLTKVMKFLHNNIDVELTEAEKKNMEEYTTRFNAERNMMTQQVFKGFHEAPLPPPAEDDDVHIVRPPPVAGTSQGGAGAVVARPRRRPGLVVDEDEDDDESPRDRRSSSQSQGGMTQTFIEID